MKTFYTLLMWVAGLTILSFPSRAQLTVEADAIIASSSDFVQANVLVDGDKSNYTYLSANLGILSTSSLTVSFPQSGHAGDIISFDIQESGDLLSLLSLSTSLLNNVTIKVYDNSNALVATGTGNSLLDLDLSLDGPKIYTLRYMTDATANYTIKRVQIELSNLLNLNTFKEFRIYNAKLQTPCPAVYADGIVSFSNSGPLGPSVSSSNNAISASTSDFATLNAPILSNPYIDLSFSTKGNAGEYVGATVNQSGAILALSLVKAVVLEVYNSAGVNVATSPSFSLADLRLLDGSTDKYYLGFITPAGTYDIAHVKITFGGLNLLTSMNVFNAMHFKLQPQPVSITSTGTTFCEGSTLSLTANAPSLSNITWNTGSTSATLIPSATNTYSFTATDAAGCVSTSSPISIIKLPRPTLTISNGGTASFCQGKTVTLSTTPSAGATVAWNTGATTNDITVSTAGTYTATATGANLCLSLPATVTVSSLPLPTLSISNGTTIDLCAGKTVTLNALPSAGATVAWNTGATTNNITVNAAGTYTATATGTNLCLSTPATVTVSSLPLPTLTLSNGSTASFCAGKTVTLSAVPSAGATVAWNTGATTNDITVSTAGTYTATATGTNLCLSTPATVSVTSLPLPTLTLSNGPSATFCAGKTVTLSAVPSAGATVAWNTGATTNDITVSTAGTYTATATGTNLCLSTPATVTVSSLPLPTLTLSNGSTASFCAGKTVTLTAVPSAGATVAWNTGATTNDLTVNTAGTYTATATGINSCLSVPATVTVTSLALPTLSISNGSTASFCAGKTVKLTAVPSAGATVAWNTGANTNDLTVNTAGTYIATATGTNSCLSLPATVTVTSLPLPTLTLSNGPTASFCAGKTVTLTSTPSAGATVAWNTGATTNNLTVNAAGTYTATATGTNSCLSIPVSVVVTSLALPTLSISNGATTGFCAGKTVILNAVASSGATVAWNTGATTNDITVSTAGTYTATATDANACISLPASVDVSSLPLPTLSISNGATTGFCTGKTVTLNTIPSAGATVVWNNGATTNDITVSTAGTYTATATDANACISLPATVVVSSLALPTLSIALDGPADFCPGQHVKITATASAGSILAWNTGATTSELTITEAGNYSVTATDANGCEATVPAIQMSHKALPEITAAANQVTCNGLSNGSIALTPKSASATYEYSWNNGSSTASILNLIPGQYTVTVQDMNSLCRKDFSYTITEPTVLQASIASTNETCAGNDGQLKFTISGGTSPYSYGIAVNNNEIAALKAGTYSFIITDANMCTQNLSATIAQANCTTALNIHNVVTPNNDGLNDVMIIDGLENYPNTSLEIFDKWGDVVYNSKDYKNNWNGRNKNDSGPLPAGTYYYLLKLNTTSVPGGEGEYTGYVMIQ